MKLSIIIMTVLLNNLNLYAQEEVANQFFYESYHYEASIDYVKSMQPLLKIYSDKSYEINIRLGWLNYKAGRHKEACDYYQKAIDLKPKSIEARFGFVLPAAALGNIEHIMAQYMAIVKIDPMNYTANYRLGLILYERKEFDKALPYFNKLHEMFPLDYQVIMMLGWCHKNKTQKKVAKDFFYKALTIKPNDLWAQEGILGCE